MAVITSLGNNQAGGFGVAALLPARVVNPMLRFYKTETVAALLIDDPGPAPVPNGAPIWADYLRACRIYTGSEIKVINPSWTVLWEGSHYDVGGFIETEFSGLTGHFEGFNGVNFMGLGILNRWRGLPDPPYGSFFVWLSPTISPWEWGAEIRDGLGNPRWWFKSGPGVLPDPEGEYISSREPPEEPCRVRWAGATWL